MHYFVPKRCAFTSKIMYHDKLAAERAAERSQLERSVDLWVYRCQDCGCWHLTSHEPGRYLGGPFARGQGHRHSRKRGYKPRQRK
ncbi:hypothetical protein BACT_0081 [Bifidobacterium actinocoloniiforme DSM 22766]|uniref:Uncharacterized protein n=1 Tax=Bifidobacterium actinocoloniiforme DSM 22766 TaxID=1437605 RepID=A0A086YYA1_9BIFI|nr:hypothetical protein [Bifidobacterium actinocoloniiforme]AKV55819.1 hypothetical protein AB656_06230 [Bifidobacterium actinocoloniiforme DSM 22766]KFI39251.1 hypothetical protein BACT_0081 [Bifidobacterium actinocoloniiforme DSM 22766]